MVPYDHADHGDVAPDCRHFVDSRWRNCSVGADLDPHLDLGVTPLRPHPLTEGRHRQDHRDQRRRHGEEREPGDSLVEAAACRPADSV